MQRIAVIDYGMGNIRSVSKAVEFACADAEVLVSADPVIIAGADKVVCPGQGAAKDCMAALRSASLDSVVASSVVEKPFLGICMGMQVLMSRSDENGGVNCLDLVAGKARKFSEGLVDEARKDGKARKLKVPHMGWSQVTQRTAHPVWQGIEQDARFYFAHSYYIDPEESEIVAATCSYGTEIAVALAFDRVFACQFHPEKSSASGLQLLRNFGLWNGHV